MHPRTTSGPPRVMHVITPSRMAGAETFLARLMRRAARAENWHTHCLTSRSPAIEELRAAGVNCEPLGIGGKGNPLALPRLAAAARHFHADLLHSHLSTASWWCGWLETLGGPPSIGQVHGFTSALWHRRQSRLIACSAAVKTDLIEKGLPPEKITVMHYPVDPDDQRSARSPTEVRAELGADDQTPLVGTFAHLSVKKGYRELIRAAEVVLRQMPTAQFWCFGEGALRDELERHARAACIADRFRLLGFRRDVPDLMRAVDVMCLPSHREPFGLVYVEAALAEKPVIACRAGGAAEIIEHGATGLLVPPPLQLEARSGKQGVPATPHALSKYRKDEHPTLGSNVPAIAEAILTLLSNRATAAAMGRRGRELALDRFGWPDYLARLSELYGQVMGRDPGAHFSPARPAA